MNREHDERATVTMSKRTPRGRPIQTVAINLERWQIILSIFALVITIAGAVYASSRFMIASEFDVRLAEFHEKAKPAIAELIDRELELHSANAQTTYERDLSDLRSRMAKLEQHALDSDARQRRIEDMLYALYTNAFGPRSPSPAPANGSH